MVSYMHKGQAGGSSRTFMAGEEGRGRALTSAGPCWSLDFLLCALRG